MSYSAYHLIFLNGAKLVFFLIECTCYRVSVGKGFTKEGKLQQQNNKY